VRRLVPRAVGDGDVEIAYGDIARQRGDNRPYVVVNMVCSADGAIALHGRTEGLSSEADRFVFHYLRSLADVILVGAQTVRAERYGPPRITDARQAERVARGQLPVPRIAVVTGSLDLDWDGRLFSESPTRPIILTTSSADTAAASKVADVIVAGNPRVDLGAALAQLYADGVAVVLCEGGPTLNGVLAAGDLIDELCLTIAPTLVGGDVGTGLLGHVHLPDLLPMGLVHAFEDDGDMFLRYRRETSGSASRSGTVEAAGAQVPAPGRTVDAFHQLMSDVELPMVIVTAGHGEHRSGCLVGFSAQASIDPPRYTVWISKHNHTYGVANRADVLTVHFPSSEQRALADLFGGVSGDDVDKFASCPAHDGPHGAVVIDEITRWFVGRVVETLDTGDHVAFVLEPLEGESGAWPGQLGFQSVKDMDAGHDA
jgi:riboflavin-specific deaminase-like protein